MYTLEEVQAGIKFLQNANVTYEYDKDDEQLRFDVDVNKRIWTSGDSIWGNGKVVKGVKVSNLSLIAQSSKQMFAEEDWAMLKEEDLYSVSYTHLTQPTTP